MNEKELIQQLQQQQEPAFRWLVDTYRNRVFHTVINMLQNAEDAEDITQEVFIKVFESIKGFKQESSLSTWIYRIAVNKSVDKLRSRKSRRVLRQWLPWWMPAAKNSSETTFYHPGIALEHKEKAAALFKAISALPEKQRVAFTLIRVQKISYAEAAGILQQSIKSIESLISRANQNLQQQLQQYHQQ